MITVLHLKPGSTTNINNAAVFGQHDLRISKILEM